MVAEGTELAIGAGEVLQVLVRRGRRGRGEGRSERAHGDAGSGAGESKG